MLPKVSLIVEAAAGAVVDVGAADEVVGALDVVVGAGAEVVGAGD